MVTWRCMKDPHKREAIWLFWMWQGIYTKCSFEESWNDPHRRKAICLLQMWQDIQTHQIQSKPSIAHSSVVEKPSLVDKSWATNCFYVVKALNSGKPSVVDNFFSEVAWKIQRWVGFKLVLSGFFFFIFFLSFSQSYHNRTHLGLTKTLSRISNNLSHDQTHTGEKPR